MFSRKSVMVVFTLIAISSLLVGCNNSDVSDMVNTGDMGRKTDKYNQYKTNPTKRPTSYAPGSRVVNLGEVIETKDFYFTRVEPAFPEASFD